MLKERGLYKRPDSQVWWIRYTVNGKEQRESSGTDNKAAARKVLRERQGGSTNSRLESDVTYEQLRTLLVQDYQRNGKDDYVLRKCRLSHLDASLAGQRMVYVGHANISRYISDRLNEKAAPATINRELAALRRMFNLAVAAELLTRVPKITALKENNRRKGFFEQEQLAAVLGHLADYLRPVVETAYYTGWRVKSELLTRKKHHVDLKNGWLRLDPGESKNNEGREFPIYGRLHTVLQDQIEATAAYEKAHGCIIPWLFHHEGRPIKGFRKAWATACRSAGIPGKFLHDFRRTAVRNMERAGVSRMDSKAMVGHKTDSIIERYAISDATSLKEAAQKLAQMNNE